MTGIFAEAVCSNNANLEALICVAATTFTFYEWVRAAGTSHHVRQKSVLEIAVFATRCRAGLVAALTLSFLVRCMIVYRFRKTAIVRRLSSIVDEAHLEGLASCAVLRPCDAKKLEIPNCFKDN
jgi:hypothetical protein